MLADAPRREATDEGSLVAPTGILRTFEEFDPGPTMMLLLLVGLFGTIVYVDLSARDLPAVAFAAVFGFYIALGVIPFRYHCVARGAIQSERGAES